MNQCFVLSCLVLFCLVVPCLVLSCLVVSFVLSLVVSFVLISFANLSTLQVHSTECSKAGKWFYLIVVTEVRVERNETRAMACHL